MSAIDEARERAAALLEEAKSCWRAATLAPDAARARLMREKARELEAEAALVMAEVAAKEGARAGPGGSGEPRNG